MEICSIEPSNLLCFYGRTVVPLKPTGRISAVTGGNLSGKSSLLDAARWCLTGSLGQGRARCVLPNRRALAEATGTFGCTVSWRRGPRWRASRTGAPSVGPLLPLYAQRVPVETGHVSRRSLRPGAASRTFRPPPAAQPHRCDSRSPPVWKDDACAKRGDGGRHPLRPRGPWNGAVADRRPPRGARAIAGPGGHRRGAACPRALPVAPRARRSARDAGAKVYLRDSGLLHSLLRVESPAALRSHPRLGASWEGFALEELARRLATPDLYDWAVHSGPELDLLAFQGGQRLGFEVKFLDAPGLERSQRQAREFLRLDRLTIVSPGTRRYPLEDWCKAVPPSELGAAVPRTDG